MNARVMKALSMVLVFLSSYVMYSSAPASTSPTIPTFTPSDLSRLTNGKSLNILLNTHDSLWYAGILEGREKQALKAIVDDSGNSIPIAPETILVSVALDVDGHPFFPFPPCLPLTLLESADKNGILS